MKEENIDNISSIDTCYSNLTSSRPNKFKLEFIEKHSKTRIGKEWIKSFYF